MADKMTEKIVKIMKEPVNIRNISVAAHIFC